jgi:hypothetical protein
MWILLTDQQIETMHFPVSIFCLMHEEAHHATPPDRITVIIKEEPQLIPGDNSLKTDRLLFPQDCQMELRIRYRFALLADSSGKQHSAKMESFQSWLVVMDPQTRRPSNLEVATKHLARTEWPFFKHRANCSRNIIRQEPSGPGIVKQIRSPLVKMSPPPLHCQIERFGAIRRPKFDVDYPGFQPFEHEETNHSSLFHTNPKRICIRRKFDGRLTREISKGRRKVSREIRGRGICFIYLLLTR